MAVDDHTPQRRTVLKGAVVAAGATALAGPFQGLVAGPAGAAPVGTLGGPAFRGLRPIPDERDGKVRLHLPEGFRYRSFHDTETPVVLDDGTELPGRHDGMGAFDGPDGAVTLIRNHEQNGTGSGGLQKRAAFDRHRGSSRGVTWTTSP